MSPLNSNKLKNFHFTTSQNNITITVQKCSVFFSSSFSIYVVMYCLFKKIFVLSFFFFSYAVYNNVQVSSLSFFFLSVFFLLSCTFLFLFSFFFFFFFIFFHNKSLIQCPFFFSTSYLPLCLYLNTITIGLLPSLFNFSL